MKVAMHLAKREGADLQIDEKITFISSKPSQFCSFR